jgi:hypothetical protein
MFDNGHPSGEKIHWSRIDLLDGESLMGLFKRGRYSSTRAILIVSGKLNLFLIVHCFIIFPEEIF